MSYYLGPRGTSSNNPQIASELLTLIREAGDGSTGLSELVSLSKPLISHHMKITVQLISRQLEFTISITKIVGFDIIYTEIKSKQGFSTHRRFFMGASLPLNKGPCRCSLRKSF